MKVYLDVDHAKANVNRVVLKRTTVIGRSTSCNLRIASSEVSREHCRINITNEQVSIRDLGSANGTFVNGERLEPGSDIALLTGTRIKVGPAEFVVHIRATPQVAPPGSTVDLPPGIRDQLARSASEVSSAASVDDPLVDSIHDEDPTDIRAAEESQSPPVHDSGFDDFLMQEGDPVGETAWFKVPPDQAPTTPTADNAVASSAEDVAEDVVPVVAAFPTADETENPGEEASGETANTSDEELAEPENKGWPPLPRRNSQPDPEPVEELAAEPGDVEASDEYAEVDGESPDQEYDEAADYEDQAENEGEWSDEESAEAYAEDSAEMPWEGVAEPEEDETRPTPPAGEIDDDLSNFLGRLGGDK